jgi:uncharacterized BrkB/YihY/UPF0761 family membrane protein
MYCSGCGQALQDGATVCANCGRTVAAPVTPVSVAETIPGFEWQLSNYTSKVRVLGIFWIIYAVVALVVGVGGLTFANALLGNHLNWFPHNDLSDNPLAEEWVRVAMHIAWVAITLRVALAFCAAWGLLTRASWGRVVAIIAAFFSILKFPFGTAMGIWTLVTMMGYRNSVLYEHLQNPNHPPAV